MKTNSQIEIAPSMLACDLTRLGEEIAALEKSGADLFHFDVMDGHFVPNITFGIPVIEQVRPLTKLPLDVHLMIAHADRFIDDFHRIGCDWLSVHIEACPHIHRTLTKIRSLGMKAGVAINPGTSLGAIESVLSEVDFVLVMSVNPGFGGQGFIDSAVERIRNLKKMINQRRIKIEVDGGIKESNAQSVVQAGAEVLVIGTGLLKSKDYRKTIDAIRLKADQAQIKGGSYART